MAWWQSGVAKSLAHELISEASLDEAFRRLYARKIAENDEYTLSLWTRTIAYLRIGLTASELQALPKIAPSDMTAIEKVL